MNPFVNPDNRDLSLPKGCKDLIDLLRPKGEAPTKMVPRTTEGLQQLDNYLSGFLSSPSDYRLLSILGFGLESGVFLEYSKGMLSAIVVIKPTRSSEENRVRESFKQAGVAPLLDAIPGGSGGARVLRYPLPTSVPDILTLIAEVLRLACGATEHAGLYYRFHYHGKAAA